MSPFPVRFPPVTDPAQDLRQVPASPCLRLCRIGEDGLCAGCLRSLDEIARWSRMDEAERRRMIDDVLAGRERERYGFLERLPGRARLDAALYPLRQPPAGEGWNRAELIDLFARADVILSKTLDDPLSRDSLDLAAHAKDDEEPAQDDE